MIRILFAACLAALAAAPVAFAQTSTSGMQGMAGMSMSQPPGNDADKAMAAGMTQMNQGMANAPATGNADQDFVVMMIPHHEGAVSMAEAELRYGHDPYLRKLATDIISAQKKEIADMQAWQQAHPAQ
jgi:uncharacterized protein (DUF305 family)